jgi:hypothetical protein
LFGCLKKLIWCDIKDDITKLDSLGFKKWMSNIWRHHFLWFILWNPQKVCQWQLMIGSTWMKIEGTVFPRSDPMEESWKVTRPRQNFKKVTGARTASYEYPRSGFLHSMIELVTWSTMSYQYRDKPRITEAMAATWERKASNRGVIPHPKDNRSPWLK